MSSLNEVISTVTTSESRRWVILEPCSTNSSALVSRVSRPCQQTKELSHIENSTSEWIIWIIFGILFVRSPNTSKENVGNCMTSSIPLEKKWRHKTNPKKLPNRFMWSTNRRKRNLLISLHSKLKFYECNVDWKILRNPQV